MVFKSIVRLIHDFIRFDHQNLLKTYLRTEPNDILLTLDFQKYNSSFEVSVIARRKKKNKEEKYECVLSIYSNHKDWYCVLKHIYKAHKTYLLVLFRLLS